MQAAESASAMVSSAVAAPRKSPAAARHVGTVIGLLALSVTSLLFTSVTVRAEGPVITMAMARYDQMQPQAWATSRNQFASSASHRLFDRTAKVAEAPAEVAAPEPDQFILSSYFEFYVKPLKTKRLFTTRRNLRDYGHSKTWASLEAGYGRVCDYRPRTVYERNGGGWEEPSCGYLKLSFSF